jgi:uncharacterized membrane protein
MRRVRRDTAGGGEIAMMAVITKAMGAFLVIMILLLPYYTSEPVAQRTAEQATEQVEQAKQQLQQAQEALKRGRLTDEEIEELLKKLEEALRQLEEALLYIRQLKIEVDQLTAQVNRLEREVEAQRREIEAQRREIAELKEEIERLKEEIERLKRDQRPRQFFWNSVRLDWSGCTGARLNLYAMSDKPSQQGGRAPPANRTAQGPFFSHDKVYSEATQYLTEAGGKTPMSGYVTLMLDRLNEGELITFYVKYLNAIPGGPLQCTLSAHWTTNRAEADGKLNDGVKSKIDELIPWRVLVRLKVGERGSLAPAPMAQEESARLLLEMARSPCEGMMCGLDDPKAKPLFVEAIIERFIGKLVPHYLANDRLAGSGVTERQLGEAVLKALGEQFVAGRMKYVDIVKWTNLVDDSTGLRGSMLSDTIRESFVARLKEAEAPAEVVELFRHRVNTGHFDLRRAMAAFAAAGMRRMEPQPGQPEDRQAASRLVEQWRRQGVDAMMAALVARMVTERRLEAPVAEELVSLIQRHRNSSQQDHSKTPAGAELQRLLDSRIASGPVRAALDPAATRVPPDQSLPLVMQIKAF